MHHPVDGVEVRGPPQGHAGRHQEVCHRSIGEVGIVGESTGGPGIAQPCLQAGGQDAGQGGEGGIVHQLGGDRVGWGDLVAGEPVPETRIGIDQFPGILGNTPFPGPLGNFCFPSD